MATAVIGGAGFIGSNLVDELMALGHEVTVLDDLSEGKRENLSRWNDHPKFQFMKGDIRDYDVIRRVVDHKDWVFHLAAMSRIQPCIENPDLAYDINVNGTTNILKACIDAGVKRLVYSSTSAIYGNSNRPPHREDMPPDCLNPYSETKKKGEELVLLHDTKTSLSTVCLRYFNVYGPRHPETGAYATAIAIFRRQKRIGRKLTITGDGEQRRDFVFVGDVVRANMMAAMNVQAGGVFNVGSGENYSINEIASLVGGDAEYIPARPAEARETLADISRASDVLGWRPTVNIKQGLLVLDRFESLNPPSLIIGTAQ